jgi:hypothetical protein
MGGIESRSKPLRGGGRVVFGGALRGVWGATSQAAPPKPPGPACCWPGLGGGGAGLPGSAASGAGRAEVWPARRRNGAALAEAIVKRGSFVTPGSETLSGDRRGGGDVCHRGL